MVKWVNVWQDIASEKKIMHGVIGNNSTTLILDNRWSSKNIPTILVIPCILTRWLNIDIMNVGMRPHGWCDTTLENRRKKCYIRRPKIQMAYCF